MYRVLIPFLFVIICILTHANAAPQKLIAVLDLVNKTQKFKVDEIYYLTDLIRKTAILIEKEDISVITKENILALLPPEKTLEECINECAIKTGQLLGADWIVTGQVIEFGESYRISTSLYTKAGILEDQQTVSGTKIEDLEKALKEASIKLFSKIDPKIAQEANESDISFQGQQIFLEVPKININQGKMNQINLEAEKLLELALDTEENKKSTPNDKMQAWCRLSLLNSTYQTQALTACQTWANYVRAYESNMAKIKEDFKTLAGYLQLKRKTLDQKKYAITVFLKTYESFKTTPEYKLVDQLINQINRGNELIIDIDQDGIADQSDQCPEQAEDKDGFQDEDGCLDVDNDQDGVPDQSDRCPSELEDKDRFEDEDGCPEFGPLDVAFLNQNMHALYFSYGVTELHIDDKSVGQSNIIGLNYQYQSEWFEYSMAITVSKDLSFYGIWAAPYIPTEFYFGLNLFSWPSKSDFSPVNLSAGMSFKYYYFAHFKSEDQGNVCVGIDTGSSFTSASCDISRKGLPIYPGFYIRNVMHIGCSYMASITLDNMPISKTAGKLEDNRDFYMTSVTFGLGWTFGSRCDARNKY
jgi:hypothetical protein